MSRPKGLPKTGGKKKGYKSPSTISKEQAREAVRVTVIQHMGRMLAAQIAHAQGIGHLYTRDKAGRFSKIETEAEIDKLLLEGREHEDYWIFAKDPSVQAFTDLMNRALDKPKEQQQEVKITTAADLSDADLEAQLRAALAALRKA